MQRATPSGLDNLEHLGLRAGVDMRPTLLRVLTDLYVQKLTHTPEEERHYTELALRLLDSVDVAVRTAVAGRLTRHLSPPLQVMERLAADLPGIAEIARGHPLLRPSVEVKAPEAPSSAATAVAEPQRQDGAAEQTSESPAIADLSTPIATDIAAELNELFFAADAEERRLILLNLEVAAPLPAGRVSLPRDASMTQSLERAALARNSEEFAQHLAQALHITRFQARRIAGDELGEPVVTAAKALGVPRDVVYRLLLFVNSAVGHSVERVHALATLYDEMTVQAAEHMVAIWQTLDVTERKTDRPAARHQPLYWNDQARVRARPANATARRAPAVQRAKERRDAS
jgi:uncharacterized protein (DUF2336 family)